MDANSPESEAAQEDGMSECLTHHHACDCREAKFAKLEADLAAAQRELAAYREPTIEDAWELTCELGRHIICDEVTLDFLKQLGFVRKVQP